MDLRATISRFLRPHPEYRSSTEQIPSSKANYALDRISRINYFQPSRTLGDANTLVPKIKRLLGNYREAIDAHAGAIYGHYAEPGKVPPSLNEVNDHMLSEARMRVRSLGRQPLWNQAWDMAWRRANEAARNIGGFYGATYSRIKTDKITERPVSDPSYDAAFYSAAFAEWQVLKESGDLDANPLEGIMQLYEMGLKPTFFREIEGEPALAFVVDTPLDTGNLGCLAGDAEVKFKHGWKDYCQNLEPTNPESENKNRKFL